jgi:hypothetical protein
MKHFLMLFFVALLGLTAFTEKNTDTILTGKVSDEHGEKLIGAIIKIMKDTTLVKGIITDFEGNYRVAIAPGTYTLEFSYTGYESKRITDVRVLPEQVNTLDIILNSGAVLEEVVVTAFKVPLIERDAASSGTVLTSESIGAVPRAAERRRSAKKEKAMAPTAAKPVPAADDSAITIRGSRAEPTTYYIDGVRVTDTPPPAEMEAMDFDMSIDMSATGKIGDDKPDMPGIPGQPTPRAGLLTAGEWNDLHNWNKHWVDLLADGEIDAYQQQYQFFPKQRYSVLLTNENNFPVSDVPVTLYDRFGKTIWEARTDNAGGAELWANIFQEKSDPDQYLAVATIDGQTKNLGILKAAESGLNHIKIERECKQANQLDIVWTVDATGSMGDELEYLKTELLDVIGRVKANNPDLSVRMGSVFYRDQGDDYIVRSSALNHDIAKTVDYIRKQAAGGGGDYPEAVHSALEEAIFKQPWSREAVARICFLVLDASPHQEPEVIASLQKSIREAAKRGIRIVPVSASGIQKDTEFLMKFFGLATNGSYVFLTDHSGVGGKHLEPTSDEYKVEQLNDLLVRLITEYSTMPSCEGKSSIRFADQQQQNNDPGQSSILYYPNPSSDQFSVELPFDADKLTLYDAEGKAVRSFSQLPVGTHRVPVNDLPPGFYTLRVWRGNQVESGKVLVVRS